MNNIIISTRENNLKQQYIIDCKESLKDQDSSEQISDDDTFEQRSQDEAEQDIDQNQIQDVPDMHDFLSNQIM